VLEPVHGFAHQRGRGAEVPLLVRHVDVPQVGGQERQLAFGVLLGSIPAHRGLGGKSVTKIVQTRAVMIGRDGHATYPVGLKLEIGELLTPGATQPRPYLSIHAITVRRGVVHLGQKDVLFAIRGAWGLYDGEASEIFFDLNGDGELDGLDPFAPPHDSIERFHPSDKYVNIGGTTYEFTVDRYGRSVTFTALATKLPPRPTLLRTSPAPDFGFTGIDGKTHRLSDYRGKVVLLDFWGAWCSPCVAAAPKLAEAYEKYRARRL